MFEKYPRLDDTIDYKSTITTRYQNTQQILSLLNSNEAAYPTLTNWESLKSNLEDWNRNYDRVQVITKLITELVEQEKNVLTRNNKNNLTKLLFNCSYQIDRYQSIKEYLIPITKYLYYLNEENINIIDEMCKIIFDGGYATQMDFKNIYNNEYEGNNNWYYENKLKKCPYEHLKPLFNKWIKNNEKKELI